MFRKFGVRGKILVIPCLMLVFAGGLQFFNVYLDNKVTEDVVYPKFGEAILDGSKQTLKTSVELAIGLLNKELEGVTDPEEKKKIIVEYTDPLRFFDDKSGYVFTYAYDGTRINNPPNKSKNGSNYLKFQDKKGNYLIKDLITAAQNGGGFVEYYWEKPGKGVQPKMSYASTIPGTEIMIGCGVYIDNVEDEKNAMIVAATKDRNRYLKYKAAGFGLLAIVGIAFSLWIVSGIIRPIVRMTSEMQQSIDQVATASDQMAMNSDQLAQVASDQAAGLQEAGSSLEEMSSMTQQSAENAEQARVSAQEADQAVHAGEEAMSRMTEAINKIQQSSDETAKIIKVIDEIAFQTNLLALNAAVEAARAGEAGKGFAVVAEEVRALAQRSAEAARGTSEMIEESVTNSKNGVDIVNDVARYLGGIRDSNSQVNELISQIAVAGNEQAQGVSQINQAIVTLDRSVQSTAASTEESASAACELADQSGKIRDLIGNVAQFIQGGKK